MGCSSVQMERGEKGTPEYESISFKGPPKNFINLDAKWHDLRFKAGEAATAEQPWADVVNDLGINMLDVLAYCKANPEMCAEQE